MIRIAISAEAFDAIAAVLPSGNVLYERERTAQGGCLVWLDESVVNNLERLRGPRDEDLSAVIVRLFGEQADEQIAELLPLSAAPSNPEAIPSMTVLTPDELFEMVNLRGRSTGLRNNIWIGPRGGARHAARIKVQTDHREKFNRGGLAVVSVEDDPPQLIEGELGAEDLELVRRYIVLNREAILAHWREETDGMELTLALKPLR
jgi:hypothetical protein